MGRSTAAPMADSPYFIAVKAATISRLVGDCERSGHAVTMDNMRMFRLRAHEVATMAELAEGPEVLCGKRGCRNEGREQSCPYAAEIHSKERPCTCCADHRRECARDI